MYWPLLLLQQGNIHSGGTGFGDRQLSAPQAGLMALLAQGIVGGDMPWPLVCVGIVMGIAMIMMQVKSPMLIAVGMYLPISVSVPIFAGGMLRLGADSLRGTSASEAETETSPGVLLSSGYIAGGTVCGLIIAFFAVLPDRVTSAIDLAHVLGGTQVAQVDQEHIDAFKKKLGESPEKDKADLQREFWRESAAVKVEELEEKGNAQEKTAKDDQQKAKAVEDMHGAVESVYRDVWLGSGMAKLLSLLAFGVLAIILFWQGLQKPPKDLAPTAPQSASF